MFEFVVREDDLFESFDVDERFWERGEAVVLNIQSFELFQRAKSFR